MPKYILAYMFQGEPRREDIQDLSTLKRRMDALRTNRACFAMEVFELTAIPAYSYVRPKDAD